MNKEEILARSRQENKEKDLYELSIEKRAGRVGVVVMYAVVLILTIISVIQTGKLNFMLWIVALSVDTAMDIYKAVKLKTAKSVISALILIVADIVATILLFNELF